MKHFSIYKHKSIKAAITVSLLFTIQLFHATTLTETENKLFAETNQLIKHHLKFPNIVFDLKETEKVEVVFTTSENGKINFVIAKTNNVLLKQHIEKKFSELVLKEIKSNVAYSIVCNFKQV